MHAAPLPIPGLRPGLTENGSALRTNTSALVSMLPTDCTSGHNTTALVSMLPTDCVSGDDTPALDDAADLTARAVTISVNPRHRRGTGAQPTAPRKRRR